MLADGSAGQPAGPQADDAGARATPSVAESPALLDADGGVLPQTDERPLVTSERFRRRMQMLAEAIIHDDPEAALATFFPLVAYERVKAVADARRDYERRLLEAFRRNVHEYHRALGKNAKAAEFLGATVPEERARWMDPGTEGNKLGYYRVLRSTLRFRVPEVGERQLELTSMISWRGEWYVVHLSGFK